MFFLTCIKAFFLDSSCFFHKTCFRPFSGFQMLFHKPCRHTAARPAWSKHLAEKSCLRGVSNLLIHIQKVSIILLETWLTLQHLLKCDQAWSTIYTNHHFVPHPCLCTLAPPGGYPKTCSDIQATFKLQGCQSSSITTQHTHTKYCN